MTECFAEAYAPPKPGSQTTPTPVRNEAEAENGEFSDFQDTEKATQAPVSKGAAMPKQVRSWYKQNNWAKTDRFLIHVSMQSSNAILDKDTSCFCDFKRLIVI